jgi:hypothetical protein
VVPHQVAAAVAAAVEVHLEPLHQADRSAIWNSVSSRHSYVCKLAVCVSQFPTETLMLCYLHGHELWPMYQYTNRPTSKVPLHKAIQLNSHTKDNLHIWSNKLFQCKNDLSKQIQSNSVYVLNNLCPSVTKHLFIIWHKCRLHYITPLILFSNIAFISALHTDPTKQMHAGM